MIFSDDYLDSRSDFYDFCECSSRIIECELLINSIFSVYFCENLDTIETLCYNFFTLICCLVIYFSYCYVFCLSNLYKDWFLLFSFLIYNLVLLSSSYFSFNLSRYNANDVVCWIGYASVWV